MPSDDAEYTVGYGRPPLNTRFKPGQTGNPKGRPKGSKSFSSIIHQIISEKVEAKGPNGIRKVTKLEAAITQLANMAAKGDKRAIREVIQLRQSLPELDRPDKRNEITVHFVKTGDNPDDLPVTGRGNREGSVNRSLLSKARGN